MFSNDKNIETIGQLVETLKHYATLQSEYIKLDVVEKTVRLLTVITMTVIISLLVILMLIYLSFAAASALAPWVGEAVGFLIVAGAYFLLLLLFITFPSLRKEIPSTFCQSPSPPLRNACKSSKSTMSGSPRSTIVRS